MANGFRCLFRSLDGKVTVDLAGGLDGAAAAEVCCRLRSRRLRNYTLNFSRLRTVDLFGARILARGLRELTQRGIHVEFDGLHEGVSMQLCLGGVFEAVI